MEDSFENVKKKWCFANQGHVFKYWDELDSQQKCALIDQLKATDIDAINKIYSTYKLQSKFVDGGAETVPFTRISEVERRSAEEVSNYQNVGLKEISKNRVAVLLMAGGQGTRLGSSLPKGLYDVNLPSHKSLFEIQAQRIIRLQILALEMHHGSSSIAIPWYIMTSSATNADTVDFFEKHNYFGLKKQDVTFFNQESFPCLNEDGSVMMASKCDLYYSPCGNGGIWFSIRSHGIYEDMRRRGVEWVYIYAVDNILVKVADPVFIGYCKCNRLKASCKIVRKRYSNELFGVLCTRNGKHKVLEYSEISPQMAEMTDENGRLLYDAAFINIFNFHISCIGDIISKLNDLPKHIAKKNIVALNSQGELARMPSLKIELFAFDIFEFLEDLDAYEINREEEFAPLKNNEDLPFDNPKTCREALSSLHRKYIEMAGGEIVDDGQEKDCEISPLISYAGESLEPYVKGKKFVLPLNLQ